MNDKIKFHKIHNHMKFLTKMFNLEQSVFIASCIYYYRFNRIKYLKNIKKSDLITMCILIAIKFTNDEAYDINARLSIAMGIPVKQINNFETFFLNSVAFDVYISNKQFLIMSCLMMTFESYDRFVCNSKVAENVKKCPYILNI